MVKKRSGKRIGRPPKKAAKLDVRVQFLVEQERDERYRQAADATELYFSEWLRRVCDAAADAQLGDK